MYVIIIDIDISNSNISEEEMLSYQLCKQHLDTEENILQCSVLKNETDVEFEKLFSENLDEVSKVLKVFKNLWKKRQNLLNQS